MDPKRCKTRRSIGSLVCDRVAICASLFQKLIRLCPRHVSWLLALDGKLHLTPLDDTKLKKVLDAGAGGGHWAM